MTNTHAKIAALQAEAEQLKVHYAALRAQALASSLAVADISNVAPPRVPSLPLPVPPPATPAAPSPQGDALPLSAEVDAAPRPSMAELRREQERGVDTVAGQAAPTFSLPSTDQLTLLLSKLTAIEKQVETTNSTVRDAALKPKRRRSWLMSPRSKTKDGSGKYESAIPWL